jgi:hypothetical protein
MSSAKRIWVLLERPGIVWLFFMGDIGVLALAWTLRRLPFALDPFLYGQLQITTGLLALIIGASALVRFRGTRDRLPLILSCGFVIVGITLTFILGIGRPCGSYVSIPIRRARLVWENPGGLQKTKARIMRPAARITRQRILPPAPSVKMTQPLLIPIGPAGDRQGQSSPSPCGRNRFYTGFSF